MFSRSLTVGSASMLTLTLAFAFAACGGGDDASPSAARAGTGGRDAGSGKDGSGFGGSGTGGSGAGGTAAGGSSGSSATGGGGADGGGVPDGAGGTDDASDAPVAECTTAADCETKLGELSQAGCATAACVANECKYMVKDADGDGHAMLGCTAAGVALPAGDDCDDANAGTHPGAWDGPEAGNKPDRCDDVDNDCNLTADDGSEAGKTCTCDPATDVQVDCALRPDGSQIDFPGGKAQGSCKLGKRDCVNGAWGQCRGAVEPKAVDTCAANNDDTCDGLPNNGATPNSLCQCAAGQSATCAAALGAKGICGQGTATCGGDGKWGACSVTPRAEVCAGDGLDEDCDGSANETEVCECTNGQTSTCSSVLGSAPGGVGACSAKPARCSNGRWDTSNCVGTTEACDCGNVDDNCNGQANEGCTCCNGQTRGCGTCGLDTQTCQGGSWGSCSGNSVPQWCRDADGDNYCGGCTSTCNFPGAGWKSAPCTSECNDGNPYTTECANTGETVVRLGQFYKPWANPACMNRYFNATCPAGMKLVDCRAVKLSLPITSDNFIDLDDRIAANECGIRLCDEFFETATIGSDAVCVWY